MNNKLHSQGQAGRSAINAARQKRRMPAADVYDLGRDIPGDRETYETAVNIIGAHGGTLLELCCGTAEIPARLLAAGTPALTAFIGVDINRRYLRQAARKIHGSDALQGRRDAIPFALHCADATGFRRPKGEEADIVLLNSAIHHVTDSEKGLLLQAAIVNLQPNGMVVVGENLLGDFADQEQHEQRVREFYQAKLAEIRRLGLGKKLETVVNDIIRRSLEPPQIEFKMCYRTLTSLVEQVGLEIIQEMQVWPREALFADRKTGDYVFVLRRAG